MGQMGRTTFLMGRTGRTNFLMGRTGRTNFFVGRQAGLLFFYSSKNDSKHKTLKHKKKTYVFLYHFYSSWGLRPQTPISLMVSWGNISSILNRGNFFLIFSLGKIFALSWDRGKFLLCFPWKNFSSIRT